MNETLASTSRMMRRALRAVTVGAFLLTIGVASLQILSRHLPRDFPIGFLWTGELSTYLLVFVIFFGAVLAEIDGGQLRIDIVRDQFVARIGAVYELFVLVSSLAFTVLIVYGSFLQAQGSWNRHGVMLTWFRIGYLYAFIMIAFATLTGLRLWRSVEILRTWIGGDNPSSDEEDRQGW